MLPKKAVTNFLEAPRDDFRRLKKLSDKQLHKRMRELPIRPPVWDRLQKDQRVMFIAVANAKRFACWADTGTGKTFTALALARYFRVAKVARRFLVLVPNNINLAEWAAEIEKHCPKLSYELLTGSSADKWNTVRKTKPLVTVGTYAGCARMVCAMEKMTSGKQCGKNKLKPVDKLVREFASTFDGLVMDESSADQAVSHRNTLPFRLCRQISKRAEVVVALSATPFGRDPTPLWAQMFLVDFGESIGPTLGLFRSAFFSESQNYWGGTDYTFRSRMSKKLNRMLAHKSLTIEADESSLPAVVEFKKRIALPGENFGYCQVVRNTLLEARGNYTETKNAFLRMRQISSGFVGYTDDDTGQRAKMTFDSNPKLESLISFLQSVAGKYKVVIFHEFIYSGDMISEQLDSAGIEWARVGGTYKKSAKAERDRFISNDKCRVIILSNGVGTMGLNLQVAKYVAFYESPTDPRKRKQARRRVERQHSKHNKVFIVDFISENTYDQRILDFHAEGRDLFEAILKGETV